MQSKPEILIKEIEKIHYARIVPATILLSLRARIEHKKNLINKLGKNFQNGAEGILLVGKGGTYKTDVLRKFYEGLQLNTINKDGKVIAKWISSTGGTFVGLYEILTTYNDSLIFLDELDFGTPTHFSIMKQICNGELVRPKHQSIEPTQFTGLVVAATNAIKLPRQNNLEHLLAMLDRLYVIKVEPPKVPATFYIEKVINEHFTKTSDVNWSLIKSALLNTNYEDLNPHEQILLKKVWEKKSLNILDTHRMMVRNANKCKSIFLFCKRFFDLQDLRQSKEVFKLAIEMIDEAIMFNPVNILSLDPLQECIYQKIKSSSECSLQQIIDNCDTNGFAISVRYIHKILDNFIRNKIINRSKWGKYSTKIIKAQPNLLPQTNLLAETL